VTADEIRELFASHERVRIDGLHPGNCRNAELMAFLGSIVPHPSFRLSPLGASLEQRPIMEVQFGDGPVHVLLWSQMHGDERTATLALCDIFGFVTRTERRPVWLDTVFRRLTVHAIPMVNPDGAERNHRCTAALIDVNRDAIALRTPEARILREAQAAIRPAYAFNLHDQSVSSAGQTTAAVALALLAPPPDPSRSVTPARMSAMKLGATLVGILRPFADGHLAAYEDTHEPRAFGDLFQALGTPTLLIESGQWVGDPEKEYIRRLNFTGLLGVLSAIAEGSVERSDIAEYASLPVNGKMVFDLIVRNVRLRAAGGWEQVVGLALMRERGAGGKLVLKEVGDVGIFGALRTLDAGGAGVPVERLVLDAPLDSGLFPDVS